MVKVIGNGSTSNSCGFLSNIADQAWDPACCSGLRRSRASEDVSEYGSIQSAFRRPAFMSVMATASSGASTKCRLVTQGFGSPSSLLPCRCRTEPIRYRSTANRPCRQRRQAERKSRYSRWCCVTGHRSAAMRPTGRREQWMSRQNKDGFFVSAVVRCVERMNLHNASDCQGAYLDESQAAEIARFEYVNLPLVSNRMSSFAWRACQFTVQLRRPSRS